MKSLKRTIKPTTRPISLDEVKRQIGIVDNYYDVDLLRMIDAATDLLEKSTGRQLISSTFELTLDDWCNDAGLSWPIELPRPPLASITSITYFDEDAAEQTLATSQYQLVNNVDMPAKLYPAATGLEWPTVQADRVDAIKITYVAGYGTEADVPAEAKQWLLLCVRHWFDNPSGVVVGQTTKEIEYAMRALRSSLGIGYYAV